MIEIKEVDPNSSSAILQCIIELQEYERTLEPLHRPGVEMAEEYLEYLKGKCLQKEGKFFVGVDNGSLVGFLCVWRGEELDEIMAYPQEVAYISDLVVLPKYRSRGIGTALLKRAESYALERGVSLLKIGALSRNGAAQELYHRLGYRDYAVKLVKKLHEGDG